MNPKDDRPVPGTIGSVVDFLMSPLRHFDVALFTALPEPSCAVERNSAAVVRSLEEDIGTVVQEPPDIYYCSWLNVCACVCEYLFRDET